MEEKREEKVAGWKIFISLLGVVLALVCLVLVSFAFQRTVEETDDGYLVSPGIDDTMATMSRDMMGDDSADVQKLIIELNGMSAIDAFGITTKIFFPFSYACVSESKDGKRVYGYGAWVADLEQVEDEAEAANRLHPDVNHRVEDREILLAGSYKFKSWFWDLVQ